MHIIYAQQISLSAIQTQKQSQHHVEIDIDNEGNTEYNKVIFRSWLASKKPRKKIKLHFVLKGSQHVATECETDLYTDSHNAKSVFYQSMLFQQIAENDDAFHHDTWPITVRKPINKETTDAVCQFFRLLYHQQQASSDFQNVLDISHTDLDRSGVIFYPKKENLAQLTVKQRVDDYVNLCSFC